MLPSLGALSLGTPTGAEDDVVTEIIDERQDAVVEGLRRRYAAEAAEDAVRREVFDNEDLVKEVLMALDRGDDVYDTCKMVARWCSLNKARRAACDEDFYSDLGKRIWGNAIYEAWLGPYANDRFRELCKVEHAVRTGKSDLAHGHAAWLGHVKRIVLAAIKASSASWETPDDALGRASKELRDDEDVVRAAVAKDPRAIRFASPRLQDLINPLRPGYFWPRKDFDDFGREWGAIVLRVLLFVDWDREGIRGIQESLAWTNASTDPETGYSTSYDNFGRLVRRLLPHIMVQIPSFANSNGIGEMNAWVDDLTR